MQQVPDTLARFFAGREDLYLLKINTSKVFPIPEPCSCPILRLILTCCKSLLQQGSSPWLPLPWKFLQKDLFLYVDFFLTYIATRIPAKRSLACGFIPDLYCHHEIANQICSPSTNSVFQLAGNRFFSPSWLSNWLSLQIPARDWHVDLFLTYCHEIAYLMHKICMLKLFVCILVSLIYTHSVRNCLMKASGS